MVVMLVVEVLLLEIATSGGAESVAVLGVEAVEISVELSLLTLEETTVVF